MKHASSNHDRHAMMVKNFRKRFWVSFVVSIPILFLSPIFDQVFGIGAPSFEGDSLVLFLLASFIFFYGGIPFFRGMKREMLNRSPGMMTLVTVAITTAYVYSAAVIFGLEGQPLFWELATLVDIMLLGHWIEMKSVMGSSRALEEIARLLPKFAHKKVSDNSFKDIPVDQLEKGDILLIKPGEKIPSDGIIIEGVTSVNESMITGESNPVSKKAGHEVIGGSVNAEGSIFIEIHKTGEESFISQMIKLVKEAQASKSKTQVLADKSAKWLTVVAIGGGFSTLFAWLLFSGQDLSFALERTVAVIAIACPHALGLAIPLVVSVSTSISAKQGILIRNRNAFESARKVDSMVFDKTGTLTQGVFSVTDIVSLDDTYSKDDVLMFAASLEQHSEHPIAKSIVDKSDKKLNPKEFTSLPGKGAKGIVDGKEVMVISHKYLKESGLTYDEHNISPIIESGKTAVFIIVDNIVVGFIALGDIVRDESRDVIKKLKSMGVRTIMITGDSKSVAERISKEIGIDEFFAEVSPEHKKNKIEELQSNGDIVAMVGDGVNDAPSLAQADIGIAVGAGTDVALESADLILIKNDLNDVFSVMKLSRSVYRKMLQNLGWATGYNIFALPLAAGVLYSSGILLSPALGALFMSLSTIIVAINARFLKVE